MSDLTPSADIGNSISKVLDAAYKELVENESVEAGLYNLFWSSVKANPESSVADSLEGTFYKSFVEDGSWMFNQEAPAYDPPRGARVAVKDSEALERDTVIDQVAEFTVREVEKRIQQSGVLPNNAGDYLLFRNGDDRVFVGCPQKYGKTYDDPKSRMKDLLGMFYRGNQQELEQVAQQIIDNAIKGTPVDVRKWIGR